MLVDLFGNEQVVHHQFEVNVPFSENAIVEFLDRAPEAMLDELGQSITAFLQEKKSGKKRAVMTETKERLYINIEWVFELSQKPAPIPFDVACDQCEVDPDHVRSLLSNKLGDEIREFYSTYACINPVDAMRVAKKLAKFVTLLH